MFRSSFADFKTAVNNPVDPVTVGSQIKPNQSRITPAIVGDLP